MRNFTYIISCRHHQWLNLTEEKWSSNTEAKYSAYSKNNNTKSRESLVNLSKQE